MKILKIGLLALGVALTLASVSKAQPPADDGMGWAPRIRAVVGYVRFTDGCRCGPHGRGVAPAAPAHVPAPRTQPGTVVFPQHPFVRSPRDFFMVD